MELETSVKRRPHIVYVTRRPLAGGDGRQGWLSVLQKVADGGDRCVTVCSLESSDDQSRPIRTRRAALRRHNIRWRTARATGTTSGLGSIADLRRLRAVVEAVVDADGADLIDARGKTAAMACRRIARRAKIPCVYHPHRTGPSDPGEDSIAERMIQGVIDRRQRAIIDDAAGLVVPTEDDAHRIVSPVSEPLLEVIPAAVDYQRFGLGGPGGVAEHADIDDASVVIARFHNGDREGMEVSMRLFDHLLLRRPDAHLVVIGDRLRSAASTLRSQNFASTSYTVVDAAEDRPRWLSAIDWAVVGTADRSREVAGKSARQLGECFASGVRPVYVGDHPEIAEWIEAAKSGIACGRIDEQAIRYLAHRVGSSPTDWQTLWEARWRTRSTFGAQQAASRLDGLYRQILNNHTSRRLRVLFLTQGTTTPASRFRVHQFIPHFRRLGIDCRVRTAYGPRYNAVAPTPAGPLYKLGCRLKRIPQGLDASRWDVVFLQRPTLWFSSLPEQLFTELNDRAVFDFDDAIFRAPDGSEHPRRRRTFEAICRRCAHVICGNDYLAEQARPLAATSVIPTVVDTDIFRPPQPPGVDENEDVVVGWMGTASNFPSLEPIADGLAQIAVQRDDVRIRLVSNQRFAPLDGVDGVEQIRWSADREVELLQSFDVGMMPLIDNPTTRGKCGFKAIQYMAVATPVVASAVGVNNEILKDPAPGIVAESFDGFLAGVRRLIDDPKLRRQMGARGRRRVERRYSIRAVVDRYVDLFESIARRKGGRTTSGGSRPREATGGGGQKVAFR